MSTDYHQDTTDHSLLALRGVLDRVSGSDQPRVVVVVVTWNSGGHVAACLDSIRRSTLAVATLVIDNDSSDSSAAVVEQRLDPDVVLLRAGANLGYAGGNNLGLELAEAADATCTVIVNPDATLDPTCLERLVEALRADPGVGLASPAICYHGTDRVWFAGSFIDPVSVATDHLHEGEPLDSLPTAPYETGRANGCVLAVAPDLLHQAGLLDERYFLYYEETDWSIRAKERGLRVVVVPSAVARHDVGHGSGAVNPTYHYYMTRNRLLLAARYGRRGTLGALPGSLQTSVLALLDMARHHRQAFLPTLGAVVHGYLDFARGRFGPRRAAGQRRTDLVRSATMADTGVPIA